MHIIQSGDARERCGSVGQRSRTFTVGDSSRNLRSKMVVCKALSEARVLLPAVHQVSDRYDRLFPNKPNASPDEEPLGALCFFNYK